MKGKIIQKGTGYCVGEINRDSLFIDTELVGDKILNAIIVWDKKKKKKISKAAENKNYKMVKDNDYIDMEHYFVNKDDGE